MSSSSSVLPPELIHMVMSYLSDEEKMRLIKIDPGTFDVLTSDERFKAEFNSKGYYRFDILDNELSRSGISCHYQSEITNRPEVLLDKLFCYLFNDIEIGAYPYRVYYYENTNKFHSDTIFRFRVWFLSEYLKLSDGNMDWLSSMYRITWDKNPVQDPENQFLMEVRRKIRECYAGEPLKNFETITNEILMIISYDNYIEDRFEVSFSLIQCDDNMDIKPKW